MKRKNDGSHGAISVFLAIILVPCMVFTCIFGDLSRVQLNMAVAESAGDLALYSLLARYDEDLKEYYGLVGSCQTIEDFYEVTQTYFQGMMAAEGVPEEGSALFAEYLRELQQGGYSDFLRCDISELTVSEVAPSQEGQVSPSALGGNPALIEDGIVEFMKYRGPITITTKLLDRFSKIDFQGQVSEAEKDEVVTDAKQAYAEDQGELLEAAFYTYLAIREYEKVQEQDICPSTAQYKTLEEGLKAARDDLLGVTTIITEYYFPGTENLRQLEKPFLDTDDYTADKEDVGIETQDEDGNELYCLDNELLEELLDGLEDDLEAVREPCETFVTSYEQIGPLQNGVNYVVYCLKVQKVIEDANLVTVVRTAGDTLLKRYAKLQAAAECEPLPEGDDLPEDWQTQLSDACDEIEKVYGGCLDKDGDSDYLKAMNEYFEKAEEVVPKVKNRQYTFSSKLTDKGGETLDGFAAQLATLINGTRGALQAQIDRLDVAIDGGTLPNGKGVKSLDELLTLAQDFTNSRNAWGNAAANSGTEYGAQEYELYQGAANVADGGQGDPDDREVEGERIAAQITGESVQELKSRLENIRSDMQSCLDTLDGITYGGVKLQDLSSASALIEAAHTAVPQNDDLLLQAAQDAARGYFQTLMQPGGETLYQAPATDAAAAGNQPDLSANTPKLYKFLKELLKEDEDGIEQKIEDNEKQNDEYKKAADDAEANATTLSEEQKAQLGKDIEDSSGGAGLDAGSALSSVVRVVTNLMEGNGDELRDQLYVCEYIMDMFSWYTFDNEGRYKLANDIEDEDKPGGGQAGGSQGSSRRVTYLDAPYATVKDQWAKEDKTEVMRNQTLTNVPINLAHNHAFAGEVEYILFGNTSLESNINTTCGAIFGIREALNIVSGFRNFYNNATISSIAASVAAATGGIVPTPVTKCVLILVLSTLETAKDLERLKAGAPVELYKARADDWYYSLEGGGFPPTSGSAQEKEDGLYYSDYLYVFLLLGLTGDTYPDMLLRVGDLIQANMRIATGDEEYSLDKTRCYFELTGKVRVRPLMMTLPIVTTVEGSSDMLQATDWCTYSLHLIRGYS